MIVQQFVTSLLKVNDVTLKVCTLNRKHEFTTCPEMETHLLF